MKQTRGSKTSIDGKDVSITDFVAVRKQDGCRSASAEENTKCYIDIDKQRSGREAQDQE